MELRTARLLLPEMTWDDVALIHQLHCVEAVAAYNTIGIPKHQGDTLSVMLSVLEDAERTPRSHYGWLLRCAEDGAFVGEAGMDLSNDRFARAELHYSLLPEFWKRGYGTEVVGCMLNFGFQQCRLHRIEAGVATENLGSVRVLEKSGLIREGIRRKILPIRGEWKDNYHYAILEEEWNEGLIGRGEKG